MTNYFRNWWGICFKSLALILLAMVDLISKPVRLCLGLLTFGWSNIIFTHLDKFLPVIDITTSFSPSEPLIAFYYREPWLSVNVNTIFSNNFSIEINSERYIGGYKWQRWAWSTI